MSLFVNTEDKILNKKRIVGEKRKFILQTSYWNLYFCICEFISPLVLSKCLEQVSWELKSCHLFEISQSMGAQLYQAKQLYTLEINSTLEIKLISPKYMLKCLVQLNAILSQKLTGKQPSVVFDNHPIIDWPRWPIIWMISECVNVMFILSTKVNHRTKVVVKIMQEFIVHLQCTHISLGIPLDMINWHYVVNAFHFLC